MEWGGGKRGAEAVLCTNDTDDDARIHAIFIALASVLFHTYEYMNVYAQGDFVELRSVRSLLSVVALRVQHWKHARTDSKTIKTGFNAN